MYVGKIKLTKELGRAKSFIKAEVDNSLLTIKPEKTHVGVYEVKMTVSDEVQSFERTMHLSVKGDGKE